MALLPLFIFSLLLCSLVLLLSPQALASLIEAPLTLAKLEDALGRPISDSARTRCTYVLDQHSSKETLGDVTIWRAVNICEISPEETMRLFPDYKEPRNRRSNKKREEEL